MSIRSFANKGTEDLFNRVDSRAARRVCPESIRRAARRRLELLNAATQLRDLAALPGNTLEKLSGDRKGQYSIRVNQQYRVCFIWTDDGPEDVEIVDYH